MNLRRIATRSAKRYGLDPRLFRRQMGAESAWSTSAVSPKGASGVAQIMPETAAAWGVNLHDNNPRDDLNAAAKHMAEYVKTYGSYRDALVAYNAGPGRVGQPLYDETRAYIQRITGGGPGQTKLYQRMAGQPGGGRGGRGGRPGTPGTPGTPRQVDFGGSGDALAAFQQLIAGPQPVGASTPARPAFAPQLAMPEAHLGTPSGPAAAPQQNALAAAMQAIRTPGDVTSTPGQSGTPGTPGTQGSQRVGPTLVIGDSLGVGTMPELKGLLGGRVGGTVKGGMPSSWGIEQLKRVARAGRLPDRIVFDMGTNDATAGELRQSLGQLARIAGGRQVVLATVNSPYEQDRKNALLRAFARNHPNVTLVKWHAASGSGSKLADGIHGAYDQRARLYARALGWTPGGGGARGDVEFMPGADRAGVPTKPVVRSFLAATAGFLGKEVRVGTGSNHKQMTDSGNVSDHWVGKGADLNSAANGFQVDGRGGDRIAAAAIQAATGWSKERAMARARQGGYMNFTPRSGPWKGRRIQIIWRAPDHHDHVHVGIA